MKNSFQFLGLLAGMLLGASGTLAQTPAAETPKHGELFLIDLPTTLRLSNARSLDVQIARERLAEAKANHTSAQWQFFPFISPGISYRKHEGRVQAVDGTIFDASKTAYTPGVTIGLQVDLGEAYFRELAARQQAQGADHGVAAQKNESALVAAQAYFDLLFAHSTVEVAQEAFRISTNYHAQTEEAVAAGLTFKGDALRVKMQAERNRLAIEQAQQQRKLASARLVQILNLDPSTELAPRTDEIVPLSFVETDSALGALVKQALENRAEIKQSTAAAAAARTSAKGAVYGPMIPTLGAKVFAGGLGGGTGGSFGNFGDQQDYLIGLSWRFGAGGMFDQGRTKAAESRANTAELITKQLQDDISRQVVDAAVRAVSLRRQIEISKEALHSASELLKLSQLRKEFAVGVVLESIQAEQDLTQARLDYLRSISNYNKAQYELARAIGMNL